MRKSDPSAAGAYARIEEALRRLGSEHSPPEGWEARAMLQLADNFWDEVCPDLTGDSLGFTGTRHGMSAWQRRAVHGLVAAARRRGIEEAHHGCCKGSDDEFHEICRTVCRGVAIVGHPPRQTFAMMRDAWRRCDEMFEPAPFLDRNQHIVDRSDVLIATPLGVAEASRGGTWDTIRRAERAAVHAVIVWRNGRITVRRFGVEDEILEPLWPLPP